MSTVVLDWGPNFSGIPEFSVFRIVNSTDLLVSGLAPSLSAVTSGYTEFEYTATSGAVHFRAELQGTSIAGLIDPPDKLATGEGTVVVGTDYGGTNNLQVLEIDTNAPVNGAFVYAFLKSDFDAGRTDKRFYLQSFTITDGGGRFRQPLYLDPGTYTLLIVHPNAAAVTQTLVVTEEFEL